MSFTPVLVAGGYGAVGQEDETRDYASATFWAEHRELRAATTSTVALLRQLLPRVNRVVDDRYCVSSPEYTPVDETVS